MGIKLFDDVVDDGENLSQIEINKEFAKRYEHNKKREDLQRLEEMKKKGLVNDSDSDTESSSESDIDDDVDDNDVKFIDALLKVRNKDPILREKDAKLFDDDDDGGDVDGDGGGERGERREKRKKPKYLKDVIAEQLIEKGPEFEEEEEEERESGEREFSRFCDRKMSEIVGLLGWTRAWPEKLLEAFFGASKSVWLVHLLANSVHQRLMIFRVEKGARFDPVYMEDMGGGGGVVKAKKLIPTMVKIMVEPGFYVYDNVVKCKVISKYYNNINSNYGSVFSGNDDV